MTKEEIAKKYFPCTCDYIPDPYCKYCSSNVEDAMEEYLQENTKWISVKEDRPPKHTDVLVYVERHDGYPSGIYMGAVLDGKPSWWVRYSEGTFPLHENIGKVTHWMPLPLPPKSITTTDK